MRHRAPQRCRRTEAGFTLLETLIALAVAGMVLGAFYQTIAVGMLLQQRSQDYADRVLVATRVLDEIGAVYPLRASSVAGRSTNGKLAWTLEITEDPVIETATGTIALAKAMRVSVSVNAEPSGGTEPFVLETIRVMPEIMP
jgi:general secretion pathway protein I